MKGHLFYECRMCAEKIVGPLVPSIDLAVYCAMNETLVPANWHGLTIIPMTMPHDCKPGRVGVAELIGGVGEDLKTLMRNRPDREGVSCK
jgi:hypothetical protein